MRHITLQARAACVSVMSDVGRESVAPTVEVYATQVGSTVSLRLTLDEAFGLAEMLSAQAWDARRKADEAIDAKIAAQVAA